MKATKNCLTVIAGCMYSGKTTALLGFMGEPAPNRRVYVPPGSAHVSVNSAGDGYILTSRTGRSFPVKVVEHPGHIVADVMGTPGLTTIGIDEAQFFEEAQLLWAVERIIRDYGIRVFVAGLDTDFRGEPYGMYENKRGPIASLLAMCDLTVRLYAECVVCGGKANRTQRLVDGKPAHYDSPTYLPGDKETYEARCRKCHKVPMNKTE